MKNIHKSQITFVIAGLLGLNAAAVIAAQKSDQAQPTRASANTSPAAAIAYLNLKIVPALPPKRRTLQKSSGA